MLTPTKLKVLLHYRNNSTMPELPDMEAVDQHDEMIEDGLIEHIPNGDNRVSFCLSSRGKYFIEYILNLPLPEQYWRLRSSAPFAPD